MRKCIIDQQTNQCVTVIELEDHEPYYTSNNNHILASRHDGEIGWVLTDGEWVYEKRQGPDISSEAIKRRNKYLQLTDKYVLPDFPLSDESKAAIVSYRQQLRDLPDQSGFPNNIVWPEQPFDILK
jgi:hypothetical protein